MSISYVKMETLVCSYKQRETRKAIAHKSDSWQQMHTACIAQK